MDLCAYGQKLFHQFCLEMFLDIPNPRHYSLFPPDAFLPDSTIKAILDNFYSINTVDDIVPYIKENHLLSSLHPAVFSFTHGLHKNFEKFRLKKKEKAAREKAEALLVVDEQLEESQLEVKGASIKWKINLRYEDFTFTGHDLTKTTILARPQSK
jgi:hypothetical protein